jgi:hypothetical protein
MFTGFPNVLSPSSEGAGLPARGRRLGAAIVRRHRDWDRPRFWRGDIVARGMDGVRVDRARGALPSSADDTHLDRAFDNRRRRGIKSPRYGYRGRDDRRTSVFAHAPSGAIVGPVSIGGLRVGITIRDREVEGDRGTPRAASPMGRPDRCGKEAVLGCGPDSAYRTEHRTGHRTLMEAIIETMLTDGGRPLRRPRAHRPGSGDYRGLGDRRPGTGRRRARGGSEGPAPMPPARYFPRFQPTPVPGTAPHPAAGVGLFPGGPMMDAGRAVGGLAWEETVSVAPVARDRDGMVRRPSGQPCAPRSVSGRDSWLHQPGGDS